MRVKTLLYKASWRVRRGYAYLRRRWGRVFRRPDVFFDGYTVEDNSNVRVYPSPIKIDGPDTPSTLPQSRAAIRRVKLSLVCVGCEGFEDWKEYLFRQTRLPDEIVLVVTGRDKAYSGLLLDLPAQSPVPMKVITSPDANIAQARNLGVLQARYDIVIMTDIEAHPRPDWLEKLAAPFEIDPQTEVSFGWRRFQKGGDRSGNQLGWPSLASINPQTVLPQSDSLAFTKEAWDISRGYPEWLDGSSVDTLFAIELKRCARYWAFVPDALVDRRAPESFNTFWRMIFLMSKGDGATGVQAGVYWQIARTGILVLSGCFISLLLIIIGSLIKIPIVSGLGILVIAGLIGGLFVHEWRDGASPLDTLQRIAVSPARVTGFLEGRKNRYEVTRRRLQSVQGIMFILSGVPIEDTGGGSRYAQIAQELLRRQFAVIYVYRYPKDETVDLPYKFGHPNLFCYSFDQFSLEEIIQCIGVNLSEYKVGVLVEIPHPDWLPLIAVLKQKGVKVIYDLVDDWNTDLGADWYSTEVEYQIIQEAYRLVATAPSLVDHLKKVAARPVMLLPNAVNLHLFSSGRQYVRPADWPVCEWSVIYIGSLYGSWFDWDLLLEIARRYPESAVVIIGDYQGQCPQVLPNVHFLGLKANRELPSYLAFSTVAIIPWKINNITNATNPIKVYEYLAMGKPVVAPVLPPLKDIPGLVCAGSQEEFVEAIGRARRAPYDKETVMRFVQENSWQARVNQLLAWIA